MCRFYCREHNGRNGNKTERNAPNVQLNQKLRVQPINEVNTNASITTRRTATTVLPTQLQAEPPTVCCVRCIDDKGGPDGVHN